MFFSLLVSVLFVFIFVGLLYLAHTEAAWNILSIFSKDERGEREPRKLYLSLPPERVTAVFTDAAEPSGEQAAFTFGRVTDCALITRAYDVAYTSAGQCCGALSCQHWCPNDAIALKRGRVTILDNCTGCGECVEHCPLHRIVLVPVDGAGATSEAGAAFAGAGTTDNVGTAFGEGATGEVEAALAGAGATSEAGTAFAGAVESAPAESDATVAETAAAVPITDSAPVTAGISVPAGGGVSADGTAPAFAAENSAPVESVAPADGSAPADGGVKKRPKGFKFWNFWYRVIERGSTDEASVIWE